MTSPDKQNTTTETTGRPPIETPQDFTARREEVGLSLEDVFARTRISMRNLSAIEQGDFSALPPPVYTKAFIKQYAALLGVDAQPFLTRYDSYLKMLDSPRTAKKSELQDGKPHESKNRLSLGLVAVFFTVMIVTAAFWFTSTDQQEMDKPHENIGQLISSPTLPGNPPPAANVPVVPGNGAEITSTPSSSQTNIPAAPVSEPASPSSATAAITNPPSTPPPNKPPMVSVSSAQKLTITAKENTWIGIRVDQQEGQQAYLRPGDTVTFTGAQFRLDVGNAGGIDLTLQGNPLPPLGKSGQIVHITLP